MTVQELIQILSKYPFDARVYTEQYNSNATNEVLYNAENNVLYIGDDLEPLFEGEDLKNIDRPSAISSPATPLWVVYVEALDGGIPFFHIEFYKTLESARRAWEDLVNEEAGLHATFTETAAIDKENCFMYWRNESTEDYVNIWVNQVEIED
jgi:hypothetical protein